MTDIDLTPFGFTPTENLAYGALLELGPSSGYALAKELSIARANAYQALNGLVAKGAAIQTDDQPQRYRAERPDAILARVIDAESNKIDALERQVATLGPRAGAPIVAISGRRGLVNLAMRMVAREPGEVTCVAPGDLIAALSPAWHRRVADDRSSVVWLVGEEEIDFPVPLAGVLDPGRISEFFGTGAFVLTAADVAIVARVGDSDVQGYWTSEPTILGTVGAALITLTAS
jgi:sugar-specific transcriptional regulator TrmB